MRAPPLLAVLGAVLLGGLWFAGHDNLSIPLAFAAEEAVLAPKPQVDAPSQQKLENAVFAGGCFWGVEGVFSHVKGVRQAVSGYRSEEHTSELQSLMRISYAVFCLKKKNQTLIILPPSIFFTLSHSLFFFTFLYHYSSLSSYFLTL